jgi:heptosyltransferase-2
MATPALRLLRTRLPGCFIGGLVRPGIDQVLAGSELLDELHVYRPGGVMGPKFAAAKVRPRRYDTVLLLTNSFSTALITRVAGIPRRVGYARDARSLLLTHRIEVPRREDGSRSVIPAVSYYWNAARSLLRAFDRDESGPLAGLELPSGVRLELATTGHEQTQAAGIMAKAGVAEAPFAVLNPGGNNAAKRWPEDRFAALAEHLDARYGLVVLINGSPGEIELIERIRAACKVPVKSLPELGNTLGSLKAILASSLCRLMVTNDTGPRHIAAAFGVPVVSLFGPTDPRWTTIPTSPGLGGLGGERIIVADPSLSTDQISDDHPERCRIDRIELETVLRAADELLARGTGAEMPGARLEQS